MMNFAKGLVAFLLLAAATGVAAQQVVGRVLVAAGPVTLVRQGAPRPAIAGTGLEIGDAVVTGAQGNAQIGFIDNSIVALRESSHFLVEQFQFQRAGAADALVFRLLRGGLRTVTGLIGLSGRGSYKITTPVASVGIRGTHYSLLSCADDCLGDNGIAAPNGTYGGVYDGRVGVGNNAGEAEFGRDEYFYVADINTIPQPLLAPPGFLADRLKGLAKNAPRPAAEPAARAADGTASAALSREAAALLPPVPVFIATETLGAAGTPRVVGGATGPSADIAFGFAHSLVESDGGVASYGGSVSIGSGPGQPTNPLTLGESAGGQTLAAFDFRPTFGRSGAVGSGGIDMRGFDPASGVHWGRWVNGSITVHEPDGALAPGTFTPPTGVHYMYGTATPDSVLAAKTGSFTFSDAGGTTPTDSNGATATSFAFGPLNVNFTTRSANLSSISISFPNATWSYANLPFNVRVGGLAQDISHVDSFAHNVGSCIGAGCGGSVGPGNATIDATGTFIGPSAGFLGMTLQGFSGAFVTTNRVAWGAVRIYRCPTCP